MKTQHTDDIVAMAAEAREVVRSMANELAAAQARIAELEAESSNDSAKLAKRRENDAVGETAIADLRRTIDAAKARRSPDEVVPEVDETPPVAYDPNEEDVRGREVDRSET